MSFHGPVVGEFGPAHVLFVDGDQRVPPQLEAEFFLMSVIEPKVSRLPAWVRRAEAGLGVSDLHRRAWARQEIIPFPGETPARGHKLTKELRSVDAYLEWYLVRCATRQETTAERSLVHAGFAVYLPRMKRWRRTASRMRKPIEQPLFGGYIFVGLFPDQSLKDVEGVEAVHAVVRFGKDRFPMPIAFYGAHTADPGDLTIARILRMELDGEFDKTRRDKRKDPVAGAEVKIIHGPFTGFAAQFVRRREDERVEVLFSLFGRSSPLVLEPSEVGGLSDD